MLVGCLPLLRPLFWRFFITAQYLKDDTSVFSLSLAWQHSVFPSGEPGVSGDSWGSQEGCQGVFLSYCAQEEPLTVGCSHRNLISALTRYIGT